RLGEQLGVAAVEQVVHDVAAHLVRRVHARPHLDVRHAGVQQVVGVVPADRGPQLNGGPGSVGLVSGRVGAIVQHAVLEVDEPGEGQLGQGALAGGGGG